VGPRRFDRDLTCSLARRRRLGDHLSVWVLNSAESAAQVRDRYRRHLDANDRIFVGAIGAWAGFNLLNRDAAVRILPK
jgi:hypothetical protein